MHLTWVSRLKYTQAETDTHRYRVTFSQFDGGLLHVWAFDDEAPYGRRLTHTREYSSPAAAKRAAQAINDHSQ